MTTHQLIMNLRGTSWDYIPDAMWRTILFGYVVPVCDGVSFDCIESPNGISELSVFEEHQPTFLRNDEYQPFECPIGHDSRTYRRRVAVFGFDRWTAELMTSIDFNAWNAGNVGSHVDELIFWAGSDVKLRAIPYEGQAYFHDLTSSERQRY